MKIQRFIISVKCAGSVVWDTPVDPFESTLYLIPPDIKKEGQCMVSSLGFFQVFNNIFDFPWRKSIAFKLLSC